MNASSRRDFFKKAITASAVFAPLSANFGKTYETAIDRAPLASAPADLKIESVKCGYIRNGHGLFLKIHTNQRIWGCGDSSKSIS